MTRKQEVFVQEYLIDLNATQAAIRAGYSQKSAQEQAARLLSNVMVQKAINVAMTEREKRLGVHQDYVISNLLEIVERAMQRAPVCNSRGEQVVDEEGRNVWTFNAKDANKALELLGRHLGMFQGYGTGRPAKNNEILERFENGDLTLKQCALEFEKSGLPIPETIRLLLAKEQPEPEDTTGGAFLAISDEEMLIRVAERKRIIEAQIGGLSERRAEMRALRDKTQDKFGPETKTNEGK